MHILSEGRLVFQKGDCRKHSKTEMKPSWSAGTAKAVKFGGWDVTRNQFKVKYSS